jgi:hypothetical protein
MTETKCEHEAVELDVSSEKTVGSNVVFTHIAARCASCGAMFKWLGNFKREPSDDRPFLSDDSGLWLALPAVPEGENAYRVLTPVGGLQ